MKENKIGFIGCGNMGKIIVTQLIKNNKMLSKNIFIYDCNENINKTMANNYGVTIPTSVTKLVSSVNILFFTVKPDITLKVIRDIRSTISKDTLVVSIAAGITVSTLNKALGNDHKIIRVMPNVPALVNEGMTAIAPNKNVNANELNEIVDIFKFFGKAEIIDEKLFHAVVGISSSSPAYIFILLEAMADAAVLGGMSRNQAYRFSAQTVKGAAEMVLLTGKHPAELKDMVCSPSGTTIAAVKILEERGFRGAIINAVQKCIITSKELSKNTI